MARSATLQGKGKLQPPTKVAVDTKAVFDSIHASDVCELAESSLKRHLLAMWDKLAAGILQQRIWTDTKDVRANGQAKGNVNRAAVQLAQDGRFNWTIQVAGHSGLHQEKTRTVKKRRIPWLDRPRGSSQWPTPSEEPDSEQK